RPARPSGSCRRRLIECNDCESDSSLSLFIAQNNASGLRAFGICAPAQNTARTFPGQPDDFAIRCLRRRHKIERIGQRWPLVNRKLKTVAIRQQRRLSAVLASDQRALSRQILEAHRGPSLIDKTEGV